ncbi:MAG: hypothetical protein MK135_04205 [Polyangiaceae bacterium]|nr:hypothetical protein [Polyangiaceae bacterium]
MSISILSVGLVMLLAGSPLAHAQAPDARNPSYEWPWAMPLWGKKMGERGIDLPLPWGVGINYLYANQPIDISRIALGVNDGEMVDMSDLIEFEEVRSRIHALNTRVDLWLFPFMNVYVMGNYVANASTEVNLSQPITLSALSEQGGGGGGFGTTVAGGAFGFFGTLDLNWTWNKMENLKDPVGTFLVTPRVGKNFGEVGGVELIFWVGAMRQKIASETKGSVQLNELFEGGGGAVQEQILNWYNELPPSRQALVRGVAGRLGTADDPVIRYELEKSIASPWNMVAGTEMGITDAWRIRAEVGFIRRTSFMFGVNYRFGLIRKTDASGGKK